MKFGSQLLLTTAGKAVQQIGIFALSIVLARYFTKEDYGHYLHVQLIVNIAIWAFLLGIPHSIYYFLPNTSHKRQYIVQIFIVVLVIALVASVGLALGNGWLSLLLSNNSLPEFVMLISLLAFFQIPMTIFEPVMISANQVSMFGKCDILFNIGFFLAVFVPVQLGKDLTFILEILVMYYACQFVVMSAIMLKLAFVLGKSPEGRVFSLKEQFTYSLPIGASQGIFELAGYTDRIIISHYFTPAQFAEYSRGAMAIPMVNVVQYQIDNLLMRRFIELFNDGDVNAMMELWHSAIRLMALFLYPIMVLFVFVGPWLIPALFSAKYVESAIIFQIYTCVLLFRVSTYNVIVRVIGRTGVLVWITLVSVGSNVIFTFWLVNILGMPGAPLATVISAGITAVAYIWVIGRYLNVGYREVFPWFSLGRILFHSLIGLIPLYPLIELNLDVWVHLVLMALVYGIACWVQLKFLPVISTAERQQLKDYLPGKLAWLL